MRLPWILLVLFIALLVGVVILADINAAKPSDFTTLTRVLATDDNAHQSKPQLRKADDNGGDPAEERLIIVGTIRNKLRGIIARIKQGCRGFKTQVNNAKNDDWLLYNARV